MLCLVVLGICAFFCHLISLVLKFGKPMLFMMIFINPLFGCLVNEVQEIHLADFFFFFFFSF
jgi:hypothetical protein